VRADGPTPPASLVGKRFIDYTCVTLRPNSAYLILSCTCMVHGIIHLVSQTHRPHARTDLQDLSHNTHKLELLASSAEQVLRLRSTTQPLALDPRADSPRNLATSRNRYERSLVQWAPLWANGLLARPLSSISLAARSPPLDLRRSKALIRGHQRSSEVIRRSKALIARAGAKCRPGRRPWPWRGSQASPAHSHLAHSHLAHSRASTRRRPAARA
jgi:hypothetical protein